jgi:transposase
MPNQTGDRVQTARHDAVPRARLLRSGDLTPVDGPTGAEEAMRDRPRAREDPLGALKADKFRRTVCLLRHDRRETGQAP